MEQVCYAAAIVALLLAALGFGFAARMYCLKSRAVRQAIAIQQSRRSEEYWRLILLKDIGEFPVESAKVYGEPPIDPKEWALWLDAICKVHARGATLEYWRDIPHHRKKLKHCAAKTALCVAALLCFCVASCLVLLFAAIQ